MGGWQVNEWPSTQLATPEEATRSESREANVVLVPMKSRLTKGGVTLKLTVAIISDERRPEVLEWPLVKERCRNGGGLGVQKCSTRGCHGVS